jgi:hypothetical protein
MTDARALAAMLRAGVAAEKAARMPWMPVAYTKALAIAAELERLADLEDGPCQCCGKACKCKEFAGELSDGA